MYPRLAITDEFGENLRRPAFLFINIATYPVLEFNIFLHGSVVYFWLIPRFSIVFVTIVDGI